MADGQNTTLDDAMRALFEMFSKPIKGDVPPHRKWIYDPEKQEFLRDPVCLMVEEIFAEIYAEMDAEEGAG